MNRGVLQSSPVQQMIAGSPNWWSINAGAMRPPPSHHQQLISSPFFPPPPASPFFPQFSPTCYSPSSSSSSSSLSLPSSWHENNQELPESWSQLLMGGLVGEEDKCGMESFHHQASSTPAVEVKQENSGGGSASYVYGNDQDFHQQATKAAAWSHQMMPVVSSPNKSCVTTFSSNMLDFSGTNKGGSDARHPAPVDRSSSECNSTASGGALKKARVQPSASQSTFKVRKEKLGDRITTLHQLVSPFGKTDTASVLLEAIGYIRFLQGQIEALSLPYLGTGSGNSMRHQQSAVQGERNSIFPEDPGQLLNANSMSMKRKGGPDQECGEEPKKDLRSRGLCLVPVSCTLQVGSDNGADYWAPATLGPGAGFR